MWADPLWLELACGVGAAALVSIIAGDARWRLLAGACAGLAAIAAPWPGAWNAALTHDDALRLAIALGACLALFVLEHARDARLVWGGRVAFAFALALFVGAPSALALGAGARLAFSPAFAVLCAALLVFAVLARAPRGPGLSIACAALALIAWRQGAPEAGALAAAAAGAAALGAHAHMGLRFGAGLFAAASLLALRDLSLSVFSCAALALILALPARAALGGAVLALAAAELASGYFLAPAWRAEARALSYAPFAAFALLAAYLIVQAARSTTKSARSAIASR